MRTLKLLAPLVFVISTTFISCGDEGFTPKPRGFFRMNFPEASYRTIEPNCPFEFEISEFAEIENYKKQNKPCWFDIRYKMFNATIHCSYDNIKGKDASEYFEDSRDLAYKHIVKSSGINEYNIYDSEAKVYGIIYEILGNTASSYQVHITDSVNHFFRASLYYDNQVNLDSVAPVTTLLKKDIYRITETFRWR